MFQVRAALQTAQPFHFASSIDKGYLQTLLIGGTSRLAPSAGKL